MIMTATEKIRLIAKRKNINLSELAEKTGQTRQNLSNKMARENLTERDIYAMAEALGVKAEIKFILPDGSEL